MYNNIYASLYKKTTYVCLCYLYVVRLAFAVKDNKELVVRSRIALLCPVNPLKLSISEMMATQGVKLITDIDTIRRLPFKSYNCSTFIRMKLVTFYSAIEP